eukprot:3442653-Amphidinium_carterae.1
MHLHVSKRVSLPCWKACRHAASRDADMIIMMCCKSNPRKARHQATSKAGPRPINLVALSARLFPTDLNH